MQIIPDPFEAHCLPCGKLDNSGGRPGALPTHFQFTFEGRRFAWCRIRKNGCSAVQQFIIETSPHRNASSKQGYRFLRKYHRIRSMQELETADHRILVVRDPLERLQSLYVNKFIQRKGCDDVFRSYRLVTGRAPSEASFAEFVFEYVSKLGSVTLDPHVWPQTWYLCNVVYDRVFPLNTLCESMAEILGHETALRFFAKKVNPSPASDLDIDETLRGRIVELYADDFRMLDRITAGC